ncbi:hypothetical protein [Spongiactinospora sp. TRM90649]|uniref:hypothetical protein n=1 Tax=Spongiactinospora sp. TRM90649 TaxID=3031114 RepID=UPI0023F755A7|nr:hypothetical protein [Spongiactinospora sp. TRM90649]MDF5758633.1 hypothetical protein [Spongiactinospora sp. TRM90649]
MLRDDSPEATVARLETACQEVFRALEKGGQTADHIHDIASWKPGADLHFYRHMTRRDAMEELKQLNPELEDDDDLGLAMSGLILHLPQDIIRVWHTADIKIPKPTTEAKLKFVSQIPERVIPLIGDDELNLGLDEIVTTPPRKNHVILQWTAEGSTIMRFDLVRPTGVKGGQVAVDWREHLLGRYTQVEDLQYRRRDDKTGTEETEAQ